MFALNLPLLQPRHLRLLPLALALVGPIAMAQAAPASEPMLDYQVQPNDKLGTLSTELLVQPSAWKEVATINHLPNPNFIKPGQRIRIPLRLLKSQPATASVVSTSGDVTVGNAKAAVGTKLAEGSQVRTGPNSSAIVELGDGSRVQLLPGSVAEVVTNRNYTMRDNSGTVSDSWFAGLIRLAQGAVETAAAKISHRATPLEIKTATSVVGVRGTEFRVAAGDAQNPNSRAEVLEGVVNAENSKQGVSADLPKGTGAVINPNDRRVTAVALLAAPNLANAPSNVLLPGPDWAWTALPGAASYRVQVAQDAGFKNIVRDYHVAANHIALADVPTGDWQVRVRGVDPQGLEGFDAAKVLHLGAALWNINNAHLAWNQGNNMLYWTPVGTDGTPVAFNGYSVEIATDPGFTHIVQTGQGQQAPVALAKLAPGNYFVRAKGNTSASASQMSHSYALEVPGDWGATVMDISAALRQVQ